MITQFGERPSQIECTAAGERRQDGVAPAHVNGIQLARDRFLLLVSTLAFRGVDDSRSILYQVRSGNYDGPVLNEGVLAQSVDDWQPFNDGRTCVRQFGHPVGFGVPKGALTGGAAAPNANVFAAKWRVCARLLAPEGYLLWESRNTDLWRRTQGVEWMQFRLNDAGDNIDVLAPPQPLRQVGYETGPAICSAASAVMNQTYVAPVPLTPDRMEWVDVNHFDRAVEGQPDLCVAALRYQYNTRRGLYEWVETGALTGPAVFEASIAPCGPDWLIAARPQHGGAMAWARAADPFKPFELRPYRGPLINAPLSVYACPDGVVRLLSGSPDVSPYKTKRHPLYCWDIDADAGCSAVNPRVAFDVYQAGLPITPEHHPIVDMCKLLPHTGGARQTMIFRVRTAALRRNDPAYGPLCRMTDDDFNSTGAYVSHVQYNRSYPGVWNF
jgi:hypothetical protein